MTRKQTNQWANRRVQAFLLRAAITLMPMVAAIAVTAVASRLVSEPTQVAGQALWLAMVVVVSTAVLLATSFALRRLLPLVTLLRLSLVFPDRAPSRFRAAMRIGSVRALEQRLEEARQGGCAGESLDETAGRVVELATALRLHDRRTRGHCERVRVYADMIGQEMGLSRSDREKLHWAAVLHDIGKLEVPGSILNKNGKPTAEEWEVLKGHPEAGRQLIAPLLDWLGPWAAAAWEHHEFWDGRGYPRGISGTQITLSGRIVSVADAFEVMTATRSYKKPLSPSAARRELTRCAGGQFDPAVVRALLSLSIGRLGWAMGPVTWVAQLPFLGWTAPAALPGTVSTIGRTIVLASAIHAVAPAMMPVTAVDAAAVAPARVPPATGHPGMGPVATTAFLAASTPPSGQGVVPGPSPAPADGPGASGEAAQAVSPVSNGPVAVTAPVSTGSGTGVQPTPAPADQQPTPSVSGVPVAVADPGASGSAPGHSGAAPGASASAPGHSGAAPGSAHGASGSAPGVSGSAPGSAPGASGSVPVSGPGVSGPAPGGQPSSSSMASHPAASPSASVPGVEVSVKATEPAPPGSTPHGPSGGPAGATSPVPPH